MNNAWNDSLNKFINSKCDADGRQLVQSKPYLYGISEGDEAGHTLLQKIGFNASVSTTEVELWSVGNTAYVYPAAGGIQMAVASSNNTDDKAAGAGALTVQIGYLDANYAEQTTTVTLNGTTRVNTTPTNILRINSFRVLTAGANGKPTGNLSLTNTGGTVTYSHIAAGFTRARNSLYTVPAGKTFYMTSISASAVGTKYMRLMVKASYNEKTGTVSTSGVFFVPYYEVMLLNMVSNKDFNAPLKFPATTDIKITAIGEAAGSVVTCDYRGWVE